MLVRRPGDCCHFQRSMANGRYTVCFFTLLIFVKVGTIYEKYVIFFDSDKLMC